MFNLVAWPNLTYMYISEVLIYNVSLYSVRQRSQLAAEVHTLATRLIKLQSMRTYNVFRTTAKAG